MTAFIGVDLAWQGDKNHSGGAVLVEASDGLHLDALSSGMVRLDDVLDFINRHSTPDTVVAVDAPLVLVNKDHQRPCERLISQRFGAAHASAHSSNLTKYPDPSSVRLARELELCGFRHCPLPHSRRLPGKWFFEVYPHPAHVVLFARERIVKYKKGRIGDRRRGLREMREELHNHCSSGLPHLVPSHVLADFLGQDLCELRGAGLKEYEDKLDATLCAYLAGCYWYWSTERTELIGDLQTGYIINPTVAARKGVAPDDRPRTAARG